MEVLLILIPITIMIIKAYFEVIKIIVGVLNKGKKDD